MTNLECKELMELWQRYAGHYGIDEFVQVLDRFDAERDRYREVLESMHKNITVVKHWAPYIICRDSWLVMIEDALKDDA